MDQNERPEFVQMVLPEKLSTLKPTATSPHESPVPSRFPEVADRHLIFSINSGRAGSKYLSQLLATAPRVKSFHEAEPKMNGRFVDMINSASLGSSRAERRIKAEAIAAILRQSSPAETYAETNHTFITTFFDVVLEDFRNVDVIILRRELAQVLKSFIEMGYFSSLNPLSFAWMSSPNAATAALPPIGPDAGLDQFDLCIAYLLDIEARAQRFLHDYPDVRIHDVRLEDLNEVGNVEKLFHALGLEASAETREVCGCVINTRAPRKARAQNPTTLEECRQRLADYAAKAEQRGIKIPGSAALDQLT